MMKNLSSLIADKRAWNAMEARAAALPRDLQVLYSEIKRYAFKITSGDGMGTINALDQILGLLEGAAIAGRGVDDVVQGDVVAFCDQHLPPTRTYADRWRESLASDLASKLKA